MPFSIVYSRATIGISAPLIAIEVQLARGMQRLYIVGLPETVVKESQHRVRSAFINSNFKFPSGRVIINLAPADLPKEGGRFDLPIALGILAASKQISTKKLAGYEFVGELALSGELRPLKGILPIVLGARDAGRCLIVPRGNAAEAGLVNHANVFFADHLLEVCSYLQEKRSLDRCTFISLPSTDNSNLDLAEVRGQPHAKRALEIAAAGKHSLLLMGPPGTGKTMLASRLPSILPELSDEHAVEVATVASVSSDGFDPAQWKKIPFRAPHHTSSGIALVGGGRPPKPGEISLAHHGVLFLDELTEFNRHALESLRESLESGKITISRAAHQAVFPAQFQLIAAMNPCPCGYVGHPKRDCRCTEDQIQRYLAKISGPLLDRIDLQVEVPALPSGILSLSASHVREGSEIVKTRIIEARQRQMTRQGKSNQELLVGDLPSYCRLTEESQRLLNQVAQKFNLSARAYHRILKVARTIADLAGEEAILDGHLGEALTYRCLDKLKSE
ncbi:MAG: comM [Gammaproteobacteria bacterium]|jgi:magnesium chelatase family protein|nr:comM [Gammaproteobacteria bacterium]